MKISLLSAFYPYRGGIAQFGAMLYRSLEKEHEVNAFTFKRQYPGFLFPGTSQFVTAEDKADKIPALRTLDSTNPYTYRSTAKKINETNCDLYIGQYWMTFFGPAMGGVQKRLKKATKRISILHNVIPHEKRFFDRRANKSFLAHNDGFVVMSDSVLKDLLSLVPNAKYLRLNHPVYSQFGEKLEKEIALNQLGLNQEFKYILFFGIIRDYKGLDLLLEAIDDLSDDFHLIVAGEVYGSFDKYQEIIDDQGLKDKVHLFNRYIPDEEVKLYFSVADVCVLPYKSATQSGITAISDHFDLPVIATDVGGLKENVLHEVTGLIVPKPDRYQISNALKIYFNNGLKSKMIQEIQIKKKENSWDNFAKKILEFSETI